MNRDEAAEFFKIAFVRLPGVWEWLQRSSPDVPATLEFWVEALATVTVPEAMSVLTRWSNGELSPPQGYQRELFHLHVLAVVRQDRSKDYERRNREEILKQTVKRSFLGDPVLGPFVNKVLDLRARIVDENELMHEVQQLVAEAHKQIDNQRRVKYEQAS